MAASRFAGLYNANEYNYCGLNGFPGALTVNTANTSTGAGATVILTYGFSNLQDGTKSYPLNTNAPINIGLGSNAETVTPTAVGNNGIPDYNAVTMTANLANTHGTGDPISSGTFGLQEAINAANAAGGGTVIVDGRWGQNGGTSAMIAAAVLPANGSVSIWDNRSGAGTIQNLTVLVPNAQVLTLFSVGVPLIPAPGAGNLIDVQDMVVENKFLTAAYTGSMGVISANYGTGVTYLASATIAAAFLTSPVANQIVKVAGALASNLSSNCLNTAVRLACATADPLTGAGSLIVKISYRVLTGF